MTGSHGELAHLDAVTALRAFRSLELSPVELLDAVVDQAGRVNGDRETGINAFTETFFDEARAEAERAATAYLRAARDEEPTAPLLGIPVATKEKHNLAGRRIEQGLAAHAGRVAAEDHPVVERIRRAGGIIHARTTTPEFSCATVTHSPMWGVTRNPWNLATTPGGSSGGAGAALAAGMTTLATASDIAGSTRVPAAFTGTVGYKAPYGRIPGLPPLSADWYRGDGPMARTVADTALLASVMSGQHPADHASWGPQGAAIELPEDPVGALRGTRIGLSLRLGDFPVEPEVEAATVDVATRLERAGAVVVPLDLPWTGDQVMRTIFAHFGHILAPAVERESGGVETLAPYAQRFIADARRAAERTSLLDSLALDAAMQRELAAAMAEVDALICPTNAVTALSAEGDYLNGIDIAGQHHDHYWQAHLTSPFNVANRCPVLSVPSGKAENGVPTGIQVVGHPHEEQQVFRIAAAIEALTPRIQWPTLTPTA
ncbi:amidase [Saccharopolyspora hirsuta]|uniref:Amidase n=1 Tax=Saccharopolyspora hirsuta TaxID=1837 RepID=A0A5M7BZ67_SACHI|nr:amidase [Saccharopolyspora hirsuta]KAA5834992.1 amidase [Saccharopolyspora hirsuta]